MGEGIGVTDRMSADVGGDRPLGGPEVDQLWAAMQAGDPGARERFCAHYLPQITRYLHGQVPPQARDDVVQDTFAAVFAALRQGNQPPGNVAGWLTRIARNMSVNYFRRTGRRRDLPGSVPPDDTLAAVADQHPADPDPDDAADAPTIEAVLSAAVTLSPARQQLFRALLESEEPKQDLLAATLGWPPGKVYTELSRLRTDLRNTVGLGAVLTAQPPCATTKELPTQAAELNRLQRAGLLRHVGGDTDRSPVEGRRARTGSDACPTCGPVFRDAVVTTTAVLAPMLATAALDRQPSTGSALSLVQHVRRTGDQLQLLSYQTGAGAVHLAQTHPALTRLGGAALVLFTAAMVTIPHLRPPDGPSAAPEPSRPTVTPTPAQPGTSGGLPLAPGPSPATNLPTGPSAGTLPFGPSNGVAQPAAGPPLGLTRDGFPFAEVTNAADGGTTVVASRNSAGGTNTISRNQHGTYDVRFGGVQTQGETAAVGAVVIRTLGPAGVHCASGSYGNTRTDEGLNVRCFDAAGNWVAAQFTAGYLREGGHSGRGGRVAAYAVTIEPADAVKAPPAERQYNSTDPLQHTPIVITQKEFARYVVTVPGVGGTGGSAVATAVYPLPRRCTVTNVAPAPGTQDLQISVSCVDASGQPAQSGFSVVYER